MDYFAENGKSSQAADLTKALAPMEAFVQARSSAVQPATSNDNASKYCVSSGEETYLTSFPLDATKGALTFAKRPSLRPFMPRIEEEDESSPQKGGIEAVVVEPDPELCAELVGENTNTKGDRASKFLNQARTQSCETVKHLVYEIAAFGERIDKLEHLLTTYMQETKSRQGALESKIAAFSTTEAEHRFMLGRRLTTAVLEEREARTREFAELRDALVLTSVTPGGSSGSDAVATSTGATQAASHSTPCVAASVAAGSPPPKLHHVSLSTNCASGSSSFIADHTAPMAQANAKAGLLKADHCGSHTRRHAEGVTIDAEELQAMSRTLADLRSQLQKDLSNARVAARLAEQEVVGALAGQEVGKAASLLATLENQVQAANNLIGAPATVGPPKASSYRGPPLDAVSLCRNAISSTEEARGHDSLRFSG
mmetsp:Transcript_102169/g.288593  ORF Transcript_102169/g.288593 Transcript_102169/m.288593 type:complete len:428 (-) Transcript_102169:139-1422(-)